MMICDSLPVLVVDDEEVLLSFLKTALERYGFKVVGRTTGTEAVDVLRGHDVAGVISDINLPGEIGGGEIFDWVQRNRPELASRFLFMTGNAMDERAEEVRTRTGAMCIQKPFRMTLLIELIQKLTTIGETKHV